MSAPVDTPTARAEALAGERIDLPGGCYWQRYSGPNRPARYEMCLPDGQPVNASTAFEDHARAVAAALAPALAAGGEPVMTSTTHLISDPRRAYTLAELDPVVRAMDPAAPTPRAAPEGGVDPTLYPRLSAAEKDVPADVRAVAEMIASVADRFVGQELHWLYLVGLSTQIVKRLATTAPGAGVDLAGMEALDAEERYLTDAVRHADDEDGPGIMPGDVEGVFHRVRAALGRDAAGRGGGAGVPEELRRLSEAATPGPWTVIAGDDYIVFSEATPTEFPHHFKGDDSGRHVAWLGNRAKDFGRADADFIAALVNFTRARIAAEDRDRGADGRDG